MAAHKTRFPDFLDNPANEVAKLLLGCRLIRTINGHIYRFRIVETESYDQNDEASHSFNGLTNRNLVMFGGSGHLYVYFTYGMHYCCNIVTGASDFGAGVLIRAIEPVDDSILGPTNGPAKLCKTLEIDLSMNGHDLRLDPFRLELGALEPGETVASSVRIGISKAVLSMNRFFIRDNPYVSRKA